MAYFFPKKDKLIVVFLDGWDVVAGNTGNLFHQQIDPFFSDLYQSSRSVFIAKEWQHHPIKSFYAGIIEMKQQFLTEQWLPKKDFWQLNKMIQIQDQLKRNNGWLWLFIPDEKLAPQINFQDCSFDKIALLTPQKTLPLARQRRLREFLNLEFADFKKDKRLINPEDIVIYLCDSSNWQQFVGLLSYQKFRPKNCFVFSDENDEGYFETIIDSASQADIRQIIKDNGLKIVEREIETENRPLIDNEDDIYFLYLKPDYFDFDLPWRLLLKRHRLLVKFIKQLINLKSRLFITSRSENPWSSHEVALLPFIFMMASKKEKKESLIEKHLKNQAASLADISPTILDFIGLEKDPKMTGSSLLPQIFPEDYLGDHESITIRSSPHGRGSLFD